MSLEPPELLALKRALGRQLAAAREAAEIGQQQVAHKTGYSRSSVAHAEAGRQLLTRDFWKTADELVKADGALLAGYDQVQTAKQEHEIRNREAELAKAYAEAQALRATTNSPLIQGCGGLVPSGQDVLLAGLVAAAGAELAGSLAGPLLYVALLTSPSQAVPIERRDHLYEQLATFLHRWAHTMDRRNYLRLLGWAATIVAASPIGNLDPEEQKRLVRAIISPRRVDTQVIDHIEAILQHCKRQEDALGPRAVLHTVLDQRQLVRSLLDECSSVLRPRLLSVYSSMSTSVGTYFFALDDPASAMHYGDQAREAAQEASNTELAIYALCMMSHFSSGQGKAHAGIDFAAAAQSLADKTEDVLLQVCIAERFASAYGVDGQYQKSMIAFDRALTGLALPADRRSPESPVYWFNEGLIASRRGDCLLGCGKAVDAAASYQNALQLFDNSIVRDLAFCTLHLGTAHLQCGEIDEAARVIGEATLLAARNHSVRLTKEVQAARTRMEPWKDIPAVRELDERLMAVGFGV